MDFFERHADKIWPEPMSGCWLWSGPVDSWGYGKYGRGYLAHRAAYEVVHGEGSAEGRVIRHQCDNPPCVNPDHLLGGTHQDNTDDMFRRGRARKARGAENANAKLTDEAVLQIRRRVAAGERTSDVATDFGLTAGHVTDIAAGKSWRHVGGEITALGPTRGERNPQAKLTSEVISDIRQRLKNAPRGTAAAIAREYGISPALVCMIRNGRRWAHLVLEA